MAKGRGSKSTKLQAAREQPKGTLQSSEKSDVKGKSKQVSEELRQAVKDLGGDDDDLDLIAGIDSDEEQDAAPSTKGKKVADGAVDEVSSDSM
jgi:ribosome biogenesis protein MAK21